MSSLRERLRSTLGRTREKLERTLGLASSPDVDWEALEETLLGADVGVCATRELLESLRKSRNGDARSVLREKLIAILSDAEPGAQCRRGSPEPIRDGGSPEPRGDGGGAPSHAREGAPSQEWRPDDMHREPSVGRPAASPPEVVLVVGVNGVGKTTTIAKLAHRYRSDGKRVLVVAADTFRAAAIEQLELWAARAGVELVRAKEGADPAAVAHDGIKAALARGIDIVIIDTAGRLHTKLPLMEELSKLGRVVQRLVPDAPHQTLLVMDATVGGNGLAQARQFREALALTGIVLTKLDGTAKGGIAIAIARELGLPVRYLGVGEGLEDLVPFSKEEFVDGLLV